MRTYDERLRPPTGLWALGLGLVLLLGLSFAVALGPGPGIAVIALFGGALTWVLVRSAAVVRVEDGTLTAGRAHIPVHLLGPVEVLDAEHARAVRGPESDPAAFHLIRGWVPAGIKVSVVDPADATPYWFVASRRPAQLAAAIDAARPA
ncbi:MAG: DUF3093 domain-containing protein [Actinomycetes bacterium]